MSRQSRNLFAASQEALKSTQTFKHGAVITGKGGKIIVSGHNKGNRTKVLNHVFTCVHAEMDVMNKLINCVLIPKYGKDYKKHIKKYSIWVVRLENRDEIKYTYSKPCFYCSRLMKYYGFSNVYYTVNNEIVNKEKVELLESSHKSDCQMKGDNVTNIMKLV